MKVVPVSLDERTVAQLPHSGLGASRAIPNAVELVRTWLDHGKNSFGQTIPVAALYDVLSLAEPLHGPADGKPYEPASPVVSDEVVERMKEALTKCRDKFREYERQHEAKAQKIFDDGKAQGLLNAERMSMQARLTKAETNRVMAAMCDEALDARTLVQP